MPSIARTACFCPDADKHEASIRRRCLLPTPHHVVRPSYDPPARGHRCDLAQTASACHHVAPSSSRWHVGESVARLQRTTAMPTSSTFKMPSQLQCPPCYSARPNRL
ncbi:hypothetical protein ACLOJK_028390 [Asimina triloba]